MTSRGVCHDPGCEGARSKTEVELYPGPGEYCPECGGRLAELNPFASVPAFDPGSWPKPPPWRARTRKALVATLVLLVGLTVAGAVFSGVRVVWRVLAEELPRPTLAVHHHARPANGRARQTPRHLRRHLPVASQAPAL